MSVLSEAESIIAKYSAMKPLLSRPSSLSAIPRFASVYHQPDTPPPTQPLTPVKSTPMGRPTTGGMPPSTASPGPSFRIVQHSASVASIADGSRSTTPWQPHDAQPSQRANQLARDNNNSHVVRSMPRDDEAFRDASPPRLEVTSPRRTVRPAVPSQRTAYIPTSDTPNRNEPTTPRQGHQQDALNGLRASYASHVQFFSEVAREEQAATARLKQDNHRLKEELMQSDMIKDEIEADTEAKVSSTQEQCSRQVLNMRKSLLLSEQAAGSLRTENEALYFRATDAEVLREELEGQRVKVDDMEKRMTILAQQNSALQRALKQKEIDMQADLDVYIKQLDLVQNQNAAMKKEMEIMTINSRQQQALEKEIERLRGKNVDLQESIRALDKEAAAMQDRVELTLQEKDDDCAREILNYRRHVVSLEKQVESLQTQLEAQVRKQRPSALQEQIGTLAKKVETLSTVLVEQELIKEELTVIAQRFEQDLDKEKRSGQEIHRLYAQTLSELAEERAAHQQARQELLQVTASLSRAVADAHQLPGVGGTLTAAPSPPQSSGDRSAS